MYRTAQQQGWDNQNVLNHAKKKAIEMGREEGREEGRKEGREEGREEMKKTMVLRMLKLGVDTTVIAAYSELSVEEINALR